MSRKANGEGSIYRRTDGRYGGSVFVELTDGTRKRVHVYSKNRQEVHDRLAEKISLDRRGIRTPDKEWTVGSYLDYWMQTVVAVKDRPRTASNYEGVVRVHLKPTLGHLRLSKLSVQDFQRLLNGKLASGTSIRTVHAIRSVLRAALSRAAREELVLRNVAKLVEIPAWHRKPITPWTPPQSIAFLNAARDHRWYGAYLMLLTYGMRRGEVLGLRWTDVDFSAERLHVEQQLQRIGADLVQGPVKTEAGRRWLPLTPAVREALLVRHIEAYGEEAATQTGDTIRHPDDLVFLSSTGTPIEPQNFVRTFHEIREGVGLPRITVHHTRHTAATALKDLGVPARDAQLILGHSHITTTQQLYQHGDIKGQTEALARVGEMLTATVAAKTAVKNELSTGESAKNHAFTSGGPGGDRTLDILLKRLLISDSGLALTPVIAHLRARTHAQIFGQVAVKYCGKSQGVDKSDVPGDTPERRQGVTDDLAILQALRMLDAELLRRRCFPLCLLTGREGSVHDPSTPPASKINTFQEGTTR